MNQENSNLPPSEPEFVSGQTYRIAYRPTRYAAYHVGLDTILACPRCGAVHWIYSDRTGTGKLPKDQLKFKCKACGQWFICNKNEVTKILGL